MNRIRTVAMVAAVVTLQPLMAGAKSVGRQLLSGSYMTPAAQSELQQLCPSGAGYPQAWTWSGLWKTRPVSATTGTPRIEQYRQGKLIATYTSFANQPGCKLAGDGTDHLNPGAPAASGCGPFTREHTWRLWMAGDTFVVSPAVYSGPYNQPWIGPQYDDGADYSAGITHTPDNITIQGLVVNNARPVILLNSPASDNTLGQAPVYFDQSTGFTIDSVNVVAAYGAAVGKAGIYNQAASNLTLSNMRISNFEVAGANGLFGADQYSGTLTLDALELDHNGGTNGPAHNAYIGASQNDPNYTVILKNSWSHSAYYGHLFKSRAQVNIMTGNYFEGGVPQPKYSQAENYLLDIPNGGRLSVRNNVFVKNASGAGANGISLTFLMEGYTDARPQSVDIENNTFVTLAKTYDGNNLNFPMAYFYPSIRPDSSSWPSGIPTRVIKNAFVGYCPAGSGSAQNYHGDIAVTESFDQMSRTYAFGEKIDADDKSLGGMYPNYRPELGTPTFTMPYQPQLLRQSMTIGAQD